MCCTLSCRRGRSLVILMLGLAGAEAWAGPPEPRGLRAVAHERVELRGGFWGPRLRTHHEVTIPHALDRLEQAGHLANFDLAAGAAEGITRSTRTCTRPWKAHCTPCSIATTPSCAGA